MAYTKHLLSAAIVAHCAFAALSAATAGTLVWTGGGDATSFTDGANWSGTPTGGTIDKAALVDDYVIDDPAATVSEGGNHTLSGGSLTVLAGEIQRPAFQGVAGALGTTSQLTVDGGIVRQWFVSANAGVGTVLEVSVGGTGELELFGAGGAVNNGDGDVMINLTGTNAKLTFLQKTAAEVVAQYQGDIFIGGIASVFGADPLTLESGDNAYIVENAASGADNVTVYSAVPEPTACGLGLASAAWIVVASRRRGA